MKNGGIVKNQKIISIYKKKSVKIWKMKNKWSNKRIQKFFQTNRNSVNDAYLGEKILLENFKKWKYGVRYWMWLWGFL